MADLLWLEVRKRLKAGEIVYFAPEIESLLTDAEALLQMVVAGNLLYRQVSMGYGDLMIPEIDLAIRRYKRKRSALPEHLK